MRTQLENPFFRLIPTTSVDSYFAELDRWGRPHHIHPVSSRHLDVRSAGPDDRLFTGDDLTTEPPPVTPGAESA